MTVFHGRSCGERRPVGRRCHRKWRKSAGPRPAPAEAFKQGQRPKQQQQRTIRGLAGRVRLRGRRKSVHEGSVAPSMALTPRNRTHPAFDRFPRPVIDPRHAWMLFEFNSTIRFRWKFIHAWRGSTRSGQSVRGGAVSECGVSAAWMRLPSLHGRTCGVPAFRHRPAKPRIACFCCCRCLCSGLGGAGRSPADKPSTLAVGKTSRSRSYSEVFTCIKPSTDGNRLSWSVYAVERLRTHCRSNPRLLAKPGENHIVIGTRVCSAGAMA